MFIELPRDIKQQYIDENIKFKYNKFVNVALTKVIKQKKYVLIIHINSNKLMYAETLSNIAYTIYELLIIYFGIGIKIQKMQYYARIYYRKIFGKMRRQKILPQNRNTKFQNTYYTV